jgi:hypothetical protein
VGFEVAGASVVGEFVGFEVAGASVIGDFVALIVGDVVGVFKNERRRMIQMFTRAS